MSAILASFNRKGRPIERLALERMLAAAADWEVDGRDIWLDGAVGLAHQHFWVTPEEHGERQPLVCQNLQAAITADVRLDNRATLGRDLGLLPSDLPNWSDAQLILLAYRKWSTACPTHLLGEFAFVIWDLASRQLFAARDPLGIRTVAYQTDGDDLWVTSAVPQLLARPGFQPTINEFKIAEYLTLFWEDHTSSFLEEISYLPPAHALLANVSSLQVWRYWDIDPTRIIHYRDERDYSEHFLEALTEAVHCRLRATTPVAVSLGGGIDSASVAALSAQLLQHSVPPRALYSFSWVFDELAEADERKWIEQLVNQYGIQATYLVGDHLWPLRDIEQWPIPHEFPSVDAYYLLRKQVMQACQAAGCRVLLTGYCAELLGHGYRYWAVDALRQGRWGELVRTALQARPNLDPKREARHAARQLVPRALRYDYRQAKRRWHRGPQLFPSQNPATAAELLQRTDFYATMLEAQRWREFSGPGQWERYRVIMTSEIPLGYGAAAGTYAAHSIQLLMPFLDQRLVELALAAPGDHLGFPGRPKYWLEQAVRDFVPPAFVTKGKTGGLDPLFERGMLEREAFSLKGILTDSIAVQRGYLSKDRLHHLHNNVRASGLDAFWLWQVVTLELWLRKYWS